MEERMRLFARICCLYLSISCSRCTEASTEGTEDGNNLRCSQVNPRTYREALVLQVQPPLH